MIRTLLITISVSVGILGPIVWMAQSYSATTKLQEQARIVDDTFLDAGITTEQVETFSNEEAPIDGLGPTVLHPPDGAVYPATFPPPRIQWTDEYASRTYAVTVRREDSIFFRGITSQREFTLPAAVWDSLRNPADPFTIEVSGGLVDPTGTLTDTLSSSEPAHIQIAPEDESPSGMMLFGAKHRPNTYPVGTVPLLMMHLRIEGFDLRRQEHRVLFRSSHGPEPTRIHPTRLAEERGEGGDGERGGPGSGPEGGDERGGPGGGPAGGDERGRPGDGPERSDERGGPGGGPEDNGERPPGTPPPDRAQGSFHGPDGPDGDITTTQCVSCHALSHDGRYIAVFSQTAEEAPTDFDAPNGFLTVLTMPERELVIQLPHAFMPQFNPVDSTKLAFGEVDETIGTKDQMMVRKSDLHILNLTTKQHRPLPGANDPDRVENFPYWSPDGKRIAFIRTKPGQMWHGARGHIDIATVPYNDGRGGMATALEGASDNGRSNFLPVYSPDGRWIVFTQADQGFFSQESSDLYIVPVAGGQARKLGCNSSHTESWHRFGPDGRWLATVTNREDIRRPHIYMSRFDTEQGTCAPAVQIPFVSGAAAHTHAFSWTRGFDWLEQYELAQP